MVHLPAPVFDSTKGIGAFNKLLAERPEALWQVLVLIFVLETTTASARKETMPGDFSWDPFNFADKFDLSAMRLRELKNGRLAMLGTTAMLVQEAVSGLGPYEQLLPH